MGYVGVTLIREILQLTRVKLVIYFLKTSGASDYIAAYPSDFTVVVTSFTPWTEARIFQSLQQTTAVKKVTDSSCMARENERRNNSSVGSLGAL